MRAFSKSKLIALRQCPKRFWLEVHHPELRSFSAHSEKGFQTGYTVGDMAQKIYDPFGTGVEIDVEVLGFQGAFARTSDLMKQAQPIFEAGFSSGGALAFADIMLPVQSDGRLGWRMIEVKSSTSVKHYHRDDAAIQAYLAIESGVALTSVAIAHIDNTWVYSGGGNYQGLLREHDITEEALGRCTEVEGWIASAQKLAAYQDEPQILPGKHCNEPFSCAFLSYCRRNEVQSEFPLQWLPNFRQSKIDQLAGLGVVDLSEIADSQLNDRQRRVKKHTLENSIYFDEEGASRDLEGYQLPIQFLVFEIIQFAIPIWAGTRPYQMIPFQFSLHQLCEDGCLLHREFLDVSGGDPSLSFIQSLIENCCENQEPIFVYNQGFEKARICELAVRFPYYKEALDAINHRIVDLLPVSRNRYYHPSQEGSWSIKAVLPAAVPELKYSDLDGVQDGGMAMEGFSEAIHPSTERERKEQLRQQLLAYCKLDTYAMVRLWQIFSGRGDLTL
ncbi:MAG: DUF2779 domain-containing protein [Burkholderiales bacterium]|nr:DUF2779 domain-containing protein [Burkholderiales bacterium]